MGERRRMVSLGEADHASKRYTWPKTGQSDSAGRQGCMPWRHICSERIEVGALLLPKEAGVAPLFSEAPKDKNFS